MIELRRRLIKSGTPFIMPTYGMQRGFLLLQPGSVPRGWRKPQPGLTGWNISVERSASKT